MLKQKHLATRVYLFKKGIKSSHECLSTKLLIIIIHSSLRIFADQTIHQLLTLQILKCASTSRHLQQG